MAIEDSQERLILDIISEMVTNDNDTGYLKCTIELGDRELEVGFLIALAEIDGKNTVAYDKIKEVLLDV